MSKLPITRLIVIYAGIILLAGYFMPQEVDWNPNFSNDYSIPYGCKILYSELGSLFPESEIKLNTESLYQVQNSISENSFMIFIDERISMDSLDSKILLDAVSNGGQVLMSAYQFPSQILDTMGVSVKLKYFLNSTLGEDVDRNLLEHGFYNPELGKEAIYNIETYGEVRYFSAVDSLEKSKGLAWMEEAVNPNFIYYNLGKGTIFLHSNPFLFTNYHILSAEGAAYLSSIFSFAPSPQQILWDEYYKSVNQQAKAKPLKVLLAEPPLRWALYLSLIGILLVLLFMSKRRQRIIPEADTFINESKELVETIGDLYFNSSNNKSILEKKISLLKQDLSREYKCFDMKAISDNVIDIYCQRTGMEQHELKELFQEIDLVSSSNKISDASLINLNHQINRLLLK